MREKKFKVERHTPIIEIVTLGEAARGEYLVFFSEDITVLNDGWLEEMLSNCQRPEVGAVGGELFFSDQRVYSAGTLLGVKGLGAHAFSGLPKEELGYCARAVMQQDVSAVSSEFMMVKKEVYDIVNQNQEYLFTDRGLANLDFCLKVKQAGYLIVYLPMAEACTERPPSKQKEKAVVETSCNPKEVDKFCEIWKSELKRGDPCYNPNLTKKRCDFSLG